MTKQVVQAHCQHVVRLGCHMWQRRVSAPLARSTEPTGMVMARPAMLHHFADLIVPHLANRSSASVGPWTLRLAPAALLLPRANCTRPARASRNLARWAASQRGKWRATASRWAPARRPPGRRAYPACSASKTARLAASSALLKLDHPPLPCGACPLCCWSTRLLSAGSAHVSPANCSTPLGGGSPPPVSRRWRAATGTQSARRASGPEHSVKNPCLVLVNRHQLDVLAAPHDCLDWRRPNVVPRLR